MPSVKLTTLYIDNLIPEAKTVEHYDKGMQGLVLRHSPTGVKSWSFTYNRKYERRRISLGAYPGVSIKLAHERARELRGAVERGEDPWYDEKVEARERELNGFRTCVEKYIESKGSQKSAPHAKRILERLAVDEMWEDRPVKEITRRDVHELLDGIKKDAPYMANHLRAQLHAMFEWLASRDAVLVNPVHGVDHCVKALPRERILSDAEIVALWKATFRLPKPNTEDDRDSPFGPAIRLLLLTGMRREEVGCLKWDEIDGNWALLPGSRMKNGRNFKAPLSPAAKRLIDEMPKGDEYVFARRGLKKRQPISGWGKAKERLDKLMAEELGLQKGETVKDWRIHDLRRTVISGLARLRTRPEVIKRIVAHTPPRSDVTGSVYNWYMYDDEAMEAVTKWASHVLQLVSGLEVVKATA